jgi:hypothetical protein
MIRQERLSGVRTIEKTIGELGAMFSKLAGLVSIQAEQIERIDTQVVGQRVAVAVFETALCVAIMQGNFALGARVVLREFILNTGCRLKTRTTT